MEKLQNDINIIQEWISKGRITRISFMVYEPDEDSDSNMPQIDYSIEGENDSHLISDCNFEHIEDVISYIAKSLLEKGKQ